MSYAIPNGSSMKHFYNRAYENEYFHCTNSTIFTKTFLEQILADIMIKHANFRNSAAAFNFIHGKNKDDRFWLDYRRLVDIFFSWYLSKYFDEILNIPFKSNIIIFIILHIF